jgi:hypothetical protein
VTRNCRKTNSSGYSHYQLCGPKPWVDRQAA